MKILVFLLGGGGGCLVIKSCLILLTPWIVACQTSLSMGFTSQEYWSRLPCPPPGDLPNPGIEPRSPTLQADGLPSEPPGKPMNIGDDSLSLLQRIFLTQESNQGLLHCRWILYQLRYQGLYRKPKAEVGLFSVILLSKSTGTSNI